VWVRLYFIKKYINDYRSMSMGKSVMGKLAELAASYYKIELKEAQVKIEELEKAKKIIKELWG